MFLAEQMLQAQALIHPKILYKIARQRKTPYL